jgi:putative flippase GtrA
MKHVMLANDVAPPALPVVAQRQRVSFTRIARFVFVGLVSAGVQLGLLEAFTDFLGWPTLVANIIAFIIATNMNLALNSAITWRDRPLDGMRGVVRRWLRFWGSISGTAIINQTIFIVALRWLPDVAAAALASTVVSIANFLLGHFFVFTASA